MSRTKRDRTTRKFADHLHDGKFQKLKRNRIGHGMKHLKSGKAATGPGGFSCNCCIKWSRKFAKIKTRRWERHVSNQEVITKDVEKDS